MTLLLLMGRGWPSALALMGGAVWCVWAYATAGVNPFPPPAASDPAELWRAGVTALPVLFAPLAAGLRGRSTRPEFWRRLEQLALAYAVGGASFACALASVGELGNVLAAGVALRGAIGLLAGVGVIAARPGTSGRMAGAIIIGAGVTLVLALVVDEHDVLAAALFMALWVGIAAAALAAQWRGVFQLAVAVIALRLTVLSFELTGDLLTNGAGLIVAGLLILGVAWAAVQVSKRFAPREEDEA